MLQLVATPERALPNGAIVNSATGFVEIFLGRAKHTRCLEAFSASELKLGGTGKLQAPHVKRVSPSAGITRLADVGPDTGDLEKPA